MVKTISGLTVLLIVVYAINAFADNKKKHPADPNAWSPYSCCHRLDDTPHRPGILVERYLVPEFYFTDTMRKGDTTFAYVCYDTRDSVLNVDTVYDDFANVHYLSLYKSFIDHIHTYRDNGKDKPLPVSLIVHRYDRLSVNRWSSITYPENKYEELGEFKNDIIRVDTFRDEDTTMHLTIESIYSYYKTVPL